MNKAQQVTITPKTFVIGLFIVAAVYVFIELRHLLVLFLLTIIFSVGLRPIVDSLEKRGVKRVFGVLIIYLLFFLVLGILLIATASTFISQLGNFITNLPELIRNILEFVNDRLPLQYQIGFENIFDSIYVQLQNQIQESGLNFSNIQDIFDLVANQIGGLGSRGIEVLTRIVEALFTFFIFLTVTAYLLVRPRKIYEGIFEYLPLQNRKKVVSIAAKVEKSLGEWLIWQLIVMFLIGFLSYIAVMIPYWIGIQGYELFQFAILIALLAGLLEALPNIGPSLTIILVLLIALGIGQSLGIMIYIVISFVLIQQFEGLFVVPNVMKRAVDLDPVITILGVTAGFILYGIIGAVMAIPVLAALKIILTEIYKKKA